MAVCFTCSSFHLHNLVNLIIPHELPTSNKGKTNKGKRAKTPETPYFHPIVRDLTVNPHSSKNSRLYLTMLRPSLQASRAHEAPRMAWPILPLPSPLPLPPIPPWLGP